MNWDELWLSLWGTTEFLGVDLGFWFAMTVVVLIVVVMNLVMWSMKPKRTKDT